MLYFKLWLENLGEEIKKVRGVWMIPFKDVQHSNTEGYYFDYGRHHTGGSISNLNNIKTGDKVADYAMNLTPYWEVSGVDIDKQIIYLNPIEPNPLITGVGAGGKKIDDHDLEVLRGEYEDKASDSIIKDWKAGKVYDISDIKYLLLGTVPVNFGPNGSQGGWYNVKDLNNNRGGRKGMTAAEIMQKDAETIKNIFKFSVPKKALDGTLDPYLWNEFVSGQSDHEDTKLEGEDFENAEILAKMALEHPQPSIKLRNVEKLLDLYSGYNSRYRKNLHQAYKNGEDTKEIEKKWDSGAYTDKSILNLIHYVALKLGNQFVKNQDSLKNYDPYFYVKEQIIHFAAKQKWYDVLRKYEDAPSNANRSTVFRKYLDMGKEDEILKIIDKEKSVGNLWEMLRQLKPQVFVPYVKKNYETLKEKFKKSSENSYYKDEFKKFIDGIIRNF